MSQRFFMTPTVIEEHVQKESGRQNREHWHIVPFPISRLNLVKLTEFSLFPDQPRVIRPLGNSNLCLGRGRTGRQTVWFDERRDVWIGRWPWDAKNTLFCRWFGNNNRGWRPTRGVKQEHLEKRPTVPHAVDLSLGHPWSKSVALPTEIIEGRLPVPFL